MRKRACQHALFLLALSARRHEAMRVAPFVVLLSLRARAFVPARPAARRATVLGMKRPLPDRWLANLLATAEKRRVAAASDDAGEPLEWAEAGSLANALSEFNARWLGGFKQWVADAVAGDFDEPRVAGRLDAHVAGAPVALLSFTTCPFCRRAKAELDERGVPWSALELDEDDDGDALRAMLGRRTGRTSVPAIFVGGRFIGGCNDGPGLMPLITRGEFEPMLLEAGVELDPDARRPPP